MRYLVMIAMFLSIATITFSQDTEPRRAKFVFGIDRSFYGYESYEATSFYLGFSPVNRFVVYGSGGFLGDGSNKGGSYGGGLTYGVICQSCDSEIPINLNASIGYQRTNFDSRSHNWLAGGVNISRSLRISDVLSVMPSISGSYNIATATFDEFVGSGNFFAYGASLNFLANGILAFARYQKYPITSFNLSLGSEFYF